MIKRCASLAFLQCLNYGLIAMSIRYLAAGSYLGLGITDGLIAFYGFTLIQKVASAESFIERVCYALGGTCGSLLGLWLTRGVHA